MVPPAKSTPGASPANKPRRHGLAIATLPRASFAGRFASTQDVAFHRHGGIELVLVTAGACRIEVAGETLEGEVGTVFVLPEDVEHNQVNVGGLTRTSYLVFHSTPLGFSSRPRTIPVGADERCLSWLEDLCRLLESPEPVPDAVAAGLLLAVLERLNQLEHRLGVSRDLPAPLARAVRYVERRQLDALRAQDIARSAGVSVSHLTALFRERFACGPLKYQQGLRLQLARKLLGNSYLTVSEVAQACGFSSANYFIRIFRGHHGLSPAKWRHAPAAARKPETTW